VHLVWAPLGTGPLRRFLESYDRYAAGVEHRLLILLNGFGRDQDLAPWRQCLESVTHETLMVQGPALDLDAYMQAVDRVPAAYYCFLNSHSVILQERWLELMMSVAAAPSVGAVGASGSWGSQYSHMRYDVGLGGPYRKVFPGREITREVFSRLSREEVSPASAVGAWTLALATIRTLTTYAIAFPPFPAPHLRSNCLLVHRDTWLGSVRTVPSDKFSAYRVENGRRGITSRLRRMGLRPMVAGRDGRAFGAAEWPESRTFWQGHQENLLIEDNQTRAYAEGDSQMRRVLSAYAWGTRADPSVSDPN
jgi:hypothetical protein